MPLVIEKKVEIVKTEELEEMELPTLIELYVGLKETLADRLKELEPMQEQIKKLSNAFQETADELLDPEAKGVLEGIEHNLAYGAKAKKVVAINKKLLIKTLGQDTYMEIANVGVGDIRKYCNPKELELILAEENTGKRSEKIKPKV